MAKRLTTFSKLLIVVIVVGAAFFGFNYLQKSGMLDGVSSDSSDTGTNKKEETSKKSAFRDDDDIIKIGIVTWGGYAGGQYFNEGFKASTESRFYQDYGLKVEFVLNDDVDASLNAWKSGDIDLHWYTIDAFPTILEGLKDFDPVVLWQADWSRGGDAVVVRRGLNSVGDLKGKSIAVAELTPSHSFLLWLLNAGGLSINDVNIKPQASAIDAAAAFKSQQVDAAVVWSPDDEQCIRAVAGAKVLESTRSASNIIADIFFAKREFVEQNRDKLQKLYQGWMIGAAEINSNPQAKAKAADILAEGLGIPRSDAEGAINNVRLVTHGDNVNFFGLNPEYKGVTGEALYARMTNEYQALGFAKDAANWRRVAYAGAVQGTSIGGNIHNAEGAKDFTKVTAEEGAEKEAIATKGLSISFRTGEYILDENAKYIIDKEFVDIAKAFGNARIRIEGNTDNVGSEASNIALSKRRAQSVADYLAKEHGMSPNRFIVVGNGPNNPVADNSTADGKAKNRRTDFELIRE
ncbi:MAG: phosphate ABC transporter substrate-binding/OmpA family protein [Saprospiraceae bacterium]